MPKTKVAVTLDTRVLGELDERVTGWRAPV